MSTIQKRPGKDGKPRWRALIRIKHNPPVSETFERKTDADRWAKATETAMAAPGGRRRPKPPWPFFLD